MRISRILGPALAFGMAGAVPGALAAPVTMEACGTAALSSANWSTFQGLGICATVRYASDAAPELRPDGQSYFPLDFIEVVLDGSTAWSAQDGRAKQDEPGQALYDSITLSGAPAPLSGPDLGSPATDVTSVFLTFAVADALLDQSVLPTDLVAGDFIEIIFGLRGAENSFLWVINPTTFGITQETVVSTVSEPGSLAIILVGGVALARVRRARAIRSRQGMGGAR